MRQLDFIIRIQFALSFNKAIILNSISDPFNIYLTILLNMYNFYKDHPFMFFFPNNEADP